MVLKAPVLVVQPGMLGHVEPHESETAAMMHTREHVRDLLAGSRNLARGCLAYEYRLTGERPDSCERRAEDAGERVDRPVVVAVDADPGDVCGAGPPLTDRRLASGDVV